MGKNVGKEGALSEDVGKNVGKEDIVTDVESACTGDIGEENGNIEARLQVYVRYTKCESKLMYTSRPAYHAFSNYQFNPLSSY